jgi:hypothetical protein
MRLLAVALLLLLLAPGCLGPSSGPAEEEGVERTSRSPSPVGTYRLTYVSLGTVNVTLPPTRDAPPSPAIRFTLDNETKEVRFNATWTYLDPVLVSSNVFLGTVDERMHVDISAEPGGLVSTFTNAALFNVQGYSQPTYKQVSFATRNVPPGADLVFEAGGWGQVRVEIEIVRVIREVVEPAS